MSSQHSGARQAGLCSSGVDCGRTRPIAAGRPAGGSIGMCASDRGGGLCGKGATGGKGSQGESDAGEKFGVHDVLPYSEGSVKKVLGQAKKAGGTDFATLRRLVVCVSAMDALYCCSDIAGSHQNG